MELSDETRRRLVEHARTATGTLRDAARQGLIIESSRRDPLVMDIHNALDALEAALLVASPAPVKDLIAQLEAQKAGAYVERDRLVCALSKLWPSHLARHPDADTTWDHDWRWIVCIHSPAGQLTWHIHDSERGWFDHLPVRDGDWDGHTTEEKYRRLAASHAPVKEEYGCISCGEAHDGGYVSGWEGHINEGAVGPFCSQCWEFLRETFHNEAASPAPEEARPPCALCGGPHPFDTVVPSVRWNAVIRKAGLPEYLCLTCIVRAFVKAGESFTAELVGDEHPFEPIEVRMRSQTATDAQALSRENNELRARIQELTAAATPPQEAPRCILGEYCRRHGFIHGAEAEELRSRLEKVGSRRVTEILDDVDARDSVAYLECDRRRTDED